MSEPFWRKQLPSIVFGLLNVFAIGLGMGVPFFAILLGFAVGWWYSRHTEAALPAAPDILRVRLRALLAAAAALATVTFVVMLIIWGGAIPSALDPSFDAAAWGIPLILYTSQASAIGWLVLMIVIAPVLQFMAVVTGGVVGLAVRPRDAGDPQ